MPRALGPIPLGAPIVERDGTITPFFRQRWQDVGAGWNETPTQGAGVHLVDQTAAVPTTTVWTVQVAGVYRVNGYLRKTRADGVGSSAEVTIGFVDLDGQALSYLFGSGGDTVGAWASVTVPIRCRALSDITVAVAYTSTTPGKMRYDLEAKVEFLP